MASNRRWLEVVAVALSALMLAGVASEEYAYLPPRDADAYHRHVHDVSLASPRAIGPWLGQDAQIEQADLDLLNPNVIISREFFNERTRRRVGLLIVQCQDARELESHYPPICYYNRGWKQLGARHVQWDLGGLRAPGMEYDFSFSSFDKSESMVVADMMILPTGKIEPDMSSVNAAAADVKNRYYGAAQIQVIFDAGVGAVERHQIVQTLLEAHRPLIDAIRLSPAWRRGAGGSATSQTGGPK